MLFMKKNIILVLFIFFISEINAQWVNTSENIETIYYISIIQKQNILIAGSRFNDRNMIISTNGGENWDYCDNGIRGKEIWSMASDSLNIYAGILDSGVYCTTNNGLNWFKRNNNFVETVFSMAYKAPYLYAGTYHGLYRSTNSGINWNVIGDFNNIQINSIFFDSNRIIVYTYNNGIYVSTDDGITWLMKNNGLNYFNMNNFFRLNDKIFTTGQGKYILQ